MKARAPSKLILSGEHAIVYGMPGLAMAVAQYVEATVEDHFLPLVSFDFADLHYRKFLQFASLKRLKHVLHAKYQRFLSGELNIRQVLLKPATLAQFACSVLLERSHPNFARGVTLKLKSDIPIGCGMGSSAAIILAIIYALASQWNIACSAEQLLHLSQKIENLQHGYSSGLDLKLSHNGGCILLKNNIMEKRPTPNWPLYMVNTGRPIASTGECVAQVTSFFYSKNLRKEFTWVTETMDFALQTGNYNLFKEMVAYNHRLLVQIGVVPQRVQQFITELAAFDAVAKICGAGSVIGESAGVLLVSTAALPSLRALCTQYQYSLSPIVAAQQGVHLV